MFYLGFPYSHLWLIPKQFIPKQLIPSTAHPITKEKFNFCAKKKEKKKKFCNDEETKEKLFLNFLKENLVYFTLFYVKN